MAAAGECVVAADVAVAYLTEAQCEEEKVRARSSLMRHDPDLTQQTLHGGRAEQAG